METLKKILEFLREYPPWVYAVVLASFAVAFTALVFGRSLQASASNVKIFSNRKEVIEDSRLSDVLKKSAQFDMIAFSAPVLKDYRSQVAEALRSGARIRVVILDPGPATATEYDRIAKLVDETPSIKREEAKQLADIVAELQHEHAVSSGTIELRYLSSRPLLYNLWFSKSSDGSQCGHLTVYFYQGFQDSPSFRTCDASSGLLANMSVEFNKVWQEALREPSPMIPAQLPSLNSPAQ